MTDIDRTMSIEVTQADRDATHEWMRGQSTGLRMMMVKPRGLYEAFARHRQQAVAAEVAQIVAMLEKWIDDTMGQSIDPAYLIKRIERGEYKEKRGE